MRLQLEYRVGTVPCLGAVPLQSEERLEGILGITLHQVADESDVAAFRDVVADGFKEEAPDMEGLIHSIFADSRALLAPDTAAFVVMDRGVPVSAAMTIVRREVAWIGWVATRAESRGHGLGRLATTAATRAGFGMGATLASLEATTDGVPVYLRIGFHEVAGYRNYCPPTTTSPM